MKLKKLLKSILVFLLCFCIVFGIFAISINLHIKSTVKEKIVSTELAQTFDLADCIFVLGCGVKTDGTPSDMLKDRLNRAIELYNLGISEKIIMSGDHGQPNYDEVNTMKNYVVNAGVPAESVFLDHAGFSTYESVYRAKEIFGVQRMVIVTQEYHLYRSLYVAEQLSIDAVGVSADYHTYAGQTLRDAREALARVKDWFNTVFKPKPTYLGDKISLDTNASVTDG